MNHKFTDEELTMLNELVGKGLAGLFVDEDDEQEPTEEPEE